MLGDLQAKGIKNLTVNLRNIKPDIKAVGDRTRSRDINKTLSILRTTIYSSDVEQYHEPSKTMYQNKQIQ